MSKGLGRLQRCILKELDLIASGEIEIVPTPHLIYLDTEDAYWGRRIFPENVQWHECYVYRYNDEDKPELNRRRASICQALNSLKRRGLVGYDKLEDRLWITNKGKIAIRIN